MAEEPWRFARMHEAYRPIIDDGRGRFPEDLRVKAPRGARAAIAAAAQIKHTTGPGSYKLKFATERGEISGVRVGLEGPPDNRSEAEDAPALARERERLYGTRSSANSANAASERI
jgi:hypothetical protein